MSFRASVLLMVLFLCSSAVVLVSPRHFVAHAEARIIRVPADFPSIQAAIDTAENGTVVLVDDGVYFEHVHVDKPLSLLGADREDTIVDGSGSGNTITVTADNVVVSGFTVRNGTDHTGVSSSGIRLENSDWCTVSDNIITMNPVQGLSLLNSNNNTISNNIVSNTGYDQTFFGTGISLQASANNTIVGNVIMKSFAWGLYFEDSVNNTIVRNTMREGVCFAFLGNSPNNTFFGNNLRFDTPFFPELFPPNDSVWSIDGRGNYWSDYVGLDDGSGGRTAGDGVGDTDLPWHGVDGYPLVAPVNPIRIWWYNNRVYPTSLISNSTVSAFDFYQSKKEVSFTVTGPANTTGYFNVSIPKALLSGPWQILLGQTDVTSKALTVENETYATIYLSYNHSSQDIQLVGTHVVPEYPNTIMIPLVLLLTLTLAILTAKKKPRRAFCKHHK